MSLPKPAPRIARAATRADSRLAPWLATACRWAPFAAAVALAWSLRGSSPGVAVADDYAFLDRVAFQHPLDPFDSMGAAYYWRPLSRQVWFSLVGPWLLDLPWLAAALHAGLLAALALLLHRITRRLAPDRPWLAPLIAASPLLAEGSRALLVWPSGVQHLLGAVGAAWAIDEAARGRRARAACAALLGALSHELAVLVLPVLPLVAGRTPGARRGPWVALACGLGAVWLAGQAVAWSHGVRPPTGMGHGVLVYAPATLPLVLMSAIGGEDLPPAAFIPVVVAGVALTAFAVAALARRRGRGAATLVLFGALASSIPLAGLWPDWNAWRALVPVVALGAGLVLALGLWSPAWAAGFIALRLAALLLASPPQPLALDAAPRPSDLSYGRIVLLQRIVDGTRRVVQAERGRLPRGARVCYWGVPPAAGVGFEERLAVRVWLDDSSATFAPFGGSRGFAKLPDLVIAYDRGDLGAPVKVSRRALETYALALEAADTRDRARTDSLYAAALLAQSPPAMPVTVAVLRNRALIALSDDRVADARRFAAESAALEGRTPSAIALEGCIALSEGHTADAERLLRGALRLDPGNHIATQGLANLARVSVAAPPR